MPEVRVIADDGEQLGVMNTRDAVRMAREKGLDLVEVAATPPRARPGLPDREKVQAQADRLAALLARLERRDL